MGDSLQLDVYGVLTTDDLSVLGAVPLDRTILGVVARFPLPPRLGTSAPGAGSLPGGGEGGVAAVKSHAPLRRQVMRDQRQGGVSDQSR